MEQADASRRNASEAQCSPGLWRAITIKASKARHATRHWAKGPGGQTCGWFGTIEEAQRFCDERNRRSEIGA